MQFLWVIFKRQYLWNEKNYQRTTGQQRGCCLISFSMYTTRMCIYTIVHVYTIRIYVQYTPCTLCSGLPLKSWNLENNDPAQSTSRSLSHREQVHKWDKLPSFGCKTILRIEICIHKNTYVYILFKYKSIRCNLKLSIVSPMERIR